MKEIKLMPLDIQLFADEEGSAANDDFDEEIDDINADDVEDTDTDTSDVEEEIIEQESSRKEVKKSTKEYSERLNKERAKMREEIEKENTLKLDRIAKSRGFENWKELEDASNKEMLEDLGVSDMDGFNKYLNSVIENNPEILQAKEIIARQRQEENQRKINDEVIEIGKLDKSIKSIEDLLKHPSYDRILARVEKGATLLDAYKLENFEALTGRATDAAVQHTLNNINNKGHMKTVSGSASTDVVVPSDIYAMYKKNLPNWTDEQIKKHYAKEIGE